MVTLVILPGLDGTDVFFRPFLARLPGGIQARVLQFPASKHRYEDLLSFVQQAVADLSEFYVLGSSFSGPLAVLLAAQEPARVRGIILAATFLRSPRPQLRPLRGALVAPVIWMLRAARRIPVWTLRRRADPLRRAKAETWARVSARDLAGRIRAVLAVEVRAAFRSCAQPILAIAFADDPVVPRRFAEEMKSIQPRTRICVIPGRHLALFTHPKPFAAEIARFIQELNPGDAARRADARSSPAESAV